MSKLLDDERSLKDADHVEINSEDRNRASFYSLFIIYGNIFFILYQLGVYVFAYFTFGNFFNFSQASMDRLYLPLLFGLTQSFILPVLCIVGAYLITKGKRVGYVLYLFSNGLYLFLIIYTKYAYSLISIKTILFFLLPLSFTALIAKELIIYQVTSKSKLFNKS